MSHRRYLSSGPILEVLERHGGVYEALREVTSKSEYGRILLALRKDKITPETGDLMATRLGIHPCRIWGAEWWSDGKYEEAS